MSRRDPEHAFQRIELDLVSIEIIESFPKIIEEGRIFPSHDDDVVNVDLNVPSDLRLEAVLHHPLVCCACVFQPEGHSSVAIDAEMCYERC